MENPNKYINGPYVQVACFCDRAIEDKTGSISLIRIIDTFITRTQGAEVPTAMPSVKNDMFLVVMLKSGEALGRNELQIIPTFPNGSTGQALIFPVLFDGDERGQNFLIRFNEFVFEYEGLYWFKVKMGEVELTSIPFHVKYFPLRVLPAAK